MRISMPALFISTLLLSGGAQAAPNDPIGSAVTVVNYVTASLETDGEQRRLSSGDDVRQQELIETDADSRSEIELNDRTKLALGPGSRLLLDKFVYDPDISGGAIVMNLVKGTFRFITGIAVKPAYVIRTPAASITVRGTIFDVYVENPNETLLLLIEGGVEVCTQSGKCLVHDEPGKLIRITADDVEKPAKWSQMNRKQDISFDGAFPFVVSPPYIDPNPIFTRDDIVLGGTEDNDDIWRARAAEEAEAAEGRPRRRLHAAAPQGEAEKEDRISRVPARNALLSEAQVARPRDPQEGCQGRYRRRYRSRRRLRSREGIQRTR